MLVFACLLLLQTPGAQAPAWSATTLEAAATEANKKVLAEAKPITVTGEIVDVSCYTQLGKRGEGHKACGTLCVASGSPAGILTSDGTLYILMAEPHHPRRDGKASLAKYLSERMAQTLTLSGMASSHGGIHTLFIPVPAEGK
ncbi:MAG: hypothetical protein HXX12_14610 [Geothrix sp.]|uniref:hypothetical protein n=1 Tax=Geothrix sp. TaxID=1962974 RepID=UPI00183D61F1|nr:hypothetical protein [Geothrix sp.]NWJ42192.1 hypothetical protein [Geothrix sp.]WIL19845.1 MAG: hypothetical protein QOZ81_002378 [Geothrix sp.]